MTEHKLTTGMTIQEDVIRLRLENEKQKEVLNLMQLDTSHIKEKEAYELIISRLRQENTLLKYQVNSLIGELEELKRT